MKTLPYLLVSGCFFALVAVAHLIRIVTAMPLTAGPWSVPLWVSWIAVLVPAALSAWAFALARRRA